MADGIEFRPVAPPARAEQVKRVESRNHEMDKKHRFLEELKKEAEEEPENSLPQEEEEEEEERTSCEDGGSEHQIDLTA